jgi:hypothetical protein
VGLSIATDSIDISEQSSMNKSTTTALRMMRKGMFVPEKLTEEILDLLPKDKRGNVCVLYSYEMIPILRERGYENITLVADNYKKYVRNFANKYECEIKKLSEVNGMEFDLTLGNPPFQQTNEEGDRKDQASNLWSKFWSDCLRGNSGVVALITPTSWTSPSADVRGSHIVDGETRLWNAFEKYSSTAKVTGVEDHFVGVGSTFGYVIVDKSGNDGLKFIEGYDTSNGFLPKSGFEEVSVNISTDVSETLGQFRTGQDNRPETRVAIPMTRKVSSDSVQILRGKSVPIGGSDKPGLYLYVYCPEKVVEQVRKRVIDCTDILNTHCRWSGFMNCEMVKRIRLNVG